LREELRLRVFENKELGDITVDLQEVGFGGMDWIELALDRGQLVSTCECGKKPSGYIKCREFLD